MSAQELEEQEPGWGILAELPGDPMIWVLISSELAVFGLLLGAFAVARVVNPTGVRRRAGAAGSAAGGREHAGAGDQRLGPPRAVRWLHVSMPCRRAVSG
jgi:heme/copper-type cytochrome/quinol oxidase subunit 3